VILDCPFVSGRALGMQFAISYNGALIYSPDPIIMDKQIGDNGQP
jgi:hydroxymethylpyrimidine pyrophosphatase-like HAD family hydrolase